MNGGRRRSMLGTRANLGLKPTKLNIPGPQLGKRPDSSGRKNRIFSVLRSPVKSEQGVVKRLFDEPAKTDKKSPLYTRLSSSTVVKDESPVKINLSRTKGNKNLEASQIHHQPKASPKNIAGRSMNSAQNFNSVSLSDGKSSKIEASKTSSSKFNLLNSSHYSYLNSGKTPKSPKSPILWSNAVKYRRPINTEPIKSPEEPEFLSRTLNMLTSTAQKNACNTSSKESCTNFLKLESPNLSAIKVMKPVEKAQVSTESVNNLYSFDTTNTSLSVLKNETVNEDTVMANGSNDDSFLDNETMCFMDANQTMRTAHDSKETTLKNASTSMNKTVLPTPRKLSVISEEIAVKCEPASCKSDLSDERLTVLMNCINDLVVSKEDFLSQQNSLFEQVKLSQDQFFLKQNEILAKVNDLIIQMNNNTDINMSDAEEKVSTVLVNPPKNEIITSRIAGNGNDDDEDLLSEDMNDGNNSLICATKKLKIFDENSETPRRSARILDKVDSARKNNEKTVQTPDSLKTKRPSGFLSSIDADEIMSEFKENSLRTPMNQKSSRSSGSISKFYTAKRLSQSTTKSSLKTPTGPRKSLADKNFSKCETPSKRSKKSPLGHGRKSMRLIKMPSASKSDANSPELDNTAVLMKNLRRTCAFLKTPKNTNRMSINASNILTPHSMSFVVQDQMKNIFSS